jgi:hypothetical protein
MKKLLLVLPLFLSFLYLRAQNLPQCDSLVIQCCDFNSLGPNTLTITVYNNSSYLFDYPNFILFNTAMDTIAKETVAYFGISTGPQQHTMDIVVPIVLPFNGTLNLYTMFGDSLCCSWPFYIPDTVTGILKAGSDFVVSIYPNPSNGKFTVSLPNEIQNADLKIRDALGRIVAEQKLNQKSASVNQHFSPGIYLLEISDAERQLLRREKLIVQ